MTCLQPHGTGVAVSTEVEAGNQETSIELIFSGS